MKHQLEPVFHFLCSLEALVRVSCFFFFPRPCERWAGVAACSRSDRWGNNLDPHNNGRGWNRRRKRKSRCASRWARSSFFSPFAQSVNPQSAFDSAGGGRQQGRRRHTARAKKFIIGFDATSPKGLFHIYMTLREPIEDVQKRGRPNDWTSLLSVTFKLTFEKNKSTF